ncbi:isoprenylcysteine carboxylmethyltransferase family protein [candidate division KSB1 bacterium]|nr:MAG: isoprenylcysteine carboxylmethyltransferase family protein [candidate division KSB1 bacterium]
MNIGHFLFKNRSYTPIPLILIALFLANPSWITIAAGFAVMLAGEFIRFYGVAYAGSATRTTAEAGGAVLITSGPFAYIRNPLYVGNFFLALGFVIMAWAWMPYMVALFLLLFFFQYTFIIKHEEEYLLKTFGEEYKIYCLNVKRWLPRFTAFIGNSIHEPNFKAAVKSEKNTLQSVIIVTVVLIIRWKLFK